jgi:Double-GTPase 2
MITKCSHQDCHDPENIGCNIEGCTILTDCKYFNKETINKEVSSTEIEGSFRIPWTANSLGLTDLNFITGSSNSILIGITGVASAGKTTFLASLYCLLRHGKKIGNYSFSGSYTLTGWEDIAWYLSWKDNSKIHFPPHTANKSGRVPGLLHLKLKNEFDKIDLIFTDAPGEWFDIWRNNTNDRNAEGAKWIYKNCNGFLLFADCETLAGSKRGQAKQQICSVADRLFENIADRPLGLIWSKSDILISETTKEQIFMHVKENPIKHFSQFETSVKEGENNIYHDNICESIDWIIKKLESNTNKLPQIISLKPNDMFLSKRQVNV